MFNNLLASYSQYKDKRVIILTKHWQGTLNARKGALLESKIPIPFLKLEPNEPLKQAGHFWNRKFWNTLSVSQASPKKEWVQASTQLADFPGPQNSKAAPRGEKVQIYQGWKKQC